MTSPATGAPDLPEYAPVPAIAKGAALNEYGYHVRQVERNLYAVTDNVYMSAFLTTPDGVVIFDAPPNIGHNIRRAVDEITAASGLTNQVTHMVYSHHHADHQGASSLFGGDIVRIGHEETRRLLLRDDDPARPVPDVTFADSYTLEVGGERVELAWHGPNHSPDNIYIHFPDHDTLMFIDVVNAGWIPIYNLNLSDDVIGYSGAPAIALDYPWTHLISGHLGRVATREDVAMHQQYIADIEASSREALASVNPGPLSSTTERTCGPESVPTSTQSPSRRPRLSSRNTPAYWAAPTSRYTPGPRHLRSCSRFASTAGLAAQSIHDRNVPGAQPRRRGQCASWSPYPGRQRTAA